MIIKARSNVERDSTTGARLCGLCHFGRKLNSTGPPMHENTAKVDVEALTMRAKFLFILENAIKRQ